MRSTTEIKRVAPSAFLASLKSTSQHESTEYAKKIVAQCKEYGLPLRDYLRLAIDPRLEETEDARRPFIQADGKAFLNGYEATLAYLNLPVREDLDAGVTLQAAADTFQTYPGTRIMFSPVLDDMVRWRYHQTFFESTEGMVAQKRTIAGNELISMFVEDSSTDYSTLARAISEGGRIPIHSIKTSEQTVKFYKFGLGYKMSYEFQRRANLDILTPYVMRTQREIEKAKVGQLTRILVNGDGVGYGAAPVYTQGSFNGTAGQANATTGKLSTYNFAAYLMQQAENGTPVDVVVGNWGMYLQWVMNFYMPASNMIESEAQRLAASGIQVDTSKILDFKVQFKLSSTAPANQLIGYTLAETAEELIEAGSEIAQSEQSIQTQEITYVRTENSGFKLAFGDTRAIFDISA